MTTAVFPGGTEILINGPAGLETFIAGSDQVDVFRSFYLNDRGQVVVSWQATGTDATFVLAYTGPGLQNPGFMTLGCDMCGGILPGSTIQTNYAYLELALGPVFPGIPPDASIYDQISTYILATGITDSGIVEADEHYLYDIYYDHPPVDVAASWNFMPTPEPSTWMLVLGAALVTLVAKWKILFH